MEPVVSVNALLLNADYRPLRMIPWERALRLLLEERVDLVTAYAREIHTATKAFPWPAVVRLRRYVEMRGRVRFSRANILARDHYTCQFCGARPVKAGGHPNLEVLTIDHVVPRAQAREGLVRLPWAGRTVLVTSWWNVVAACDGDNLRKGARTPGEAGLTLRAYPKPPSPLDALRIAMSRVSTPAEWDPWIPEGWRDYWNVALEETG